MKGYHAGDGVVQKFIEDVCHFDLYRPNEKLILIRDGLDKTFVLFLGIEDLLLFA